MISYIALFYIVHLEALKYDLKAIARTRQRACGHRDGLGIRDLRHARRLRGDLLRNHVRALGVRRRARMGAAGLALVDVHRAARVLGALSDLPQDDPNAPVVHLPEAWPTTRAGLHFFVPIVVLLWCLMIEELSPGTSAFWATATTMAMSSRARAPRLSPHRRDRCRVSQGLRGSLAGPGARRAQHVGIAVACASAGLIVGAVTLTGMGLMMTDFVEYISAGNVLAMLVLTAVICLLLGAGVQRPRTTSSSRR